MTLTITSYRAIRNCPLIKRVVYVSCNPTGNFTNDISQFVSTGDRRLKGEAFRPIKAIPVDMFPYT